mmetsp:Transcript_14434/g.27508  ORF Transcript_14434/g.27508 Transcript_14434/m.27508 type:complete len:228 (-) Transcript_14434:83-766(-)
MGRYTTVQAYADNNPSIRAVPYEQATGTASAATPAERGPVQTEKVDNPYGSTAGAGSGEFHVYRHARAREMARWKKINEEEAERTAEEEFRKKVEEEARAEESKTEKRRLKRMRAKEAKRRKKNMKLGGVGFEAGDDGNGKGGEGGEEEEFKYTPTIANPQGEGGQTSGNNDSMEQVGDDSPISRESSASTDEDQKPSGVDNENSQIAFPSDGSFLDRMKNELVKAE